MNSNGNNFNNFLLFPTDNQANNNKSASSLGEFNNSSNAKNFFGNRNKSERGAGNNSRPSMTVAVQEAMNK